MWVSNCVSFHDEIASQDEGIRKGQDVVSCLYSS